LGGMDHARSSGSQPATGADSGDDPMQSPERKQTRRNGVVSSHMADILKMSIFNTNRKDQNPSRHGAHAPLKDVLTTGCSNERGLHGTSVRNTPEKSSRRKQ